MSERKYLNRRVATLGIIFVLGVGLVLQTIVNQIDRTQNARMKSLVDGLQSEVDSSHLITQLRLVEFWVNQTVNQSANSYSSWTNQSSYAGALSVNVVHSTTNNTYVEVRYHVEYLAAYIYYINFTQRIEVGSSGTACFPILPAPVEIRVGNTDLAGEVTVTVEIVYVY
jgi:hypothetical protein